MLEERAVSYIYKLIKYEKIKWLSNYYRKKLVFDFGIWVGRNCKIGKGLVLPHPQGIIIGNNVKIGNNVTIYQQVTIGRKRGGYPKISSGCVIYPGAKLFGKIEIRENSIIGAQSVVLKSTEKNGVYAGVPARKLQR